MCDSRQPLNGADSAPLPIAWDAHRARLRIQRGEAAAACETLIGRLMRGLDTSGDCWVWRRAANSAGYGVMAFHGVRHYVHRLAFVLYRGAIPDGLELDHLCKNTRCANPDHLDAVTHQVNMSRSNSLTSIDARSETCRRGHPWATSAYRRPNGYRMCRDCCNYRRRMARLVAA